MIEDLPEPSELDDIFVDQVRDALAHLYGHAYLQTHPLAEFLGLIEGPDIRQRTGLLRAILLKAVEALNPEVGSFRSLPARSYNVLNLHYVEGLTIQEVGRELGLSERQVYRELRKAERDVATLLMAQQRTCAQELQDETLSRGDLVRREAERVGGEPDQVDVGALLRGVIEAVQRLADQCEIKLTVDWHGGVEHVHTWRLWARQALVMALSQAIQSAVPQSTVAVVAQGLADRVRIEIAYVRPESEANTPPLSEAAQQLVKRLGGRCHSEPSGDGKNAVRILLKLGGPTHGLVLVVDDNEGMVELFRRYLADGEYLLVGASTAREGMRLADELVPDIVVLDIMMPQQDGWEVLQTLRLRQATRGIPVIVCSVLDDPELAYSLGADCFLAKPVTREQLLAALEQCRSGIRPRQFPATLPDSASPHSESIPGADAG